MPDLTAAKWKRVIWVHWHQESLWWQGCPQGNHWAHYQPGSALPLPAGSQHSPQGALCEARVKGRLLHAEIRFPEITEERRCWTDRKVSLTIRVRGKVFWCLVFLPWELLPVPCGQSTTGSLQSGGGKGWPQEQPYTPAHTQAWSVSPWSIFLRKIVYSQRSHVPRDILEFFSPGKIAWQLSDSGQRCGYF